MSEPVTLRLRNSFRTEVTAGKHSFVLDEPVSAGGSDEGATPYDMLAAALGGCTAMTLQFYAKREKIPLEGVDVTLEHDRQHAKDCADCSTSSGYIHRFSMTIRLLGELSEEQRSDLLRVAGRCPVSRILTSEIKVDYALVP